MDKQLIFRGVRRTCGNISYVFLGIFIHVVHLAWCRQVTKDKDWEGVEAVEARCLIRMAAKSGNVGVFNRAMKIVLLRGKVKRTRTRENNPRVRG